MIGFNEDIDKLFIVLADQYWVSNSFEASKWATLVTKWE